jgi:hypothetical protein
MVRAKGAALNASSGHRGGRGRFSFCEWLRPFGFATPYSSSMPRQKDERILASFNAGQKFNDQSVEE